MESNLSHDKPMTTNTHTFLKEGFFVKKFKKVLALSLALAMGLSLVACNGGSGDTTAPNSGDNTSAEPGSEQGGGEGSTFYIYVWNDEFPKIMANYMPGYTSDSDFTGGVMDDGTRVEFVTNASADMLYQTELDKALTGSKQVDMFLVEADYATKYTSADAGVAMDVKDLGLTDDDLANMYDYAKNIVTDTNGVTRGVSWQCAPGFFAYRKDIAQEVLGVSDAADVQAKINSWDNFNAVAKQMKDAGYYMVSDYTEGSRNFNAARSSAWVNDGVVSVPAEVDEWCDMAKDWYDKGYMHGGNNFDGTGNWGADMGEDGKVFGYFACTWYLNFCMKPNTTENPESEDYKWGLCQGPDAFYWGGTWMCASTSCTNTALAYDIMYNLTCNVDVMKEMAKKELNFANNKKAMEEYANEFTGDDAFAWLDLGDDNYFSMCLDFAEAIDVDVTKMTPYDQIIESYQSAVAEYFNGTVSKDDALANFYTSVTEKYQELSAE